MSFPIEPSENDNTLSKTTIYQKEFLEDLEYWVEKDRKLALRIIKLMRLVERDPFSGEGKPEQLKYQQEDNVWSRRITMEHRLVYIVTEDQIKFLQARHHY